MSFYSGVCSRCACSRWRFPLSAAGLDVSSRVSIAQMGQAGVLRAPYIVVLVWFGAPCARAEAPPSRRRRIELRNPRRDWRSGPNRPSVRIYSVRILQRTPPKQGGKVAHPDGIPAGAARRARHVSGARPPSTSSRRRGRA